MEDRAGDAIGMGPRAMKVITWMLIRLVASRFAAILVGVSIFVLSLEAVSYAPEILALRPGDSGIMADYFLKRAPAVLSAFLPISMLLAMLLALTELSYRNEIAALWATGLSPLRIMILLLPLGLLAGGLHFYLGNQAIPDATPTLRAWGIGDYGREKFKINEKDPVWMRAGPDVLRAGRVNAESTALTDVIIFRRDGSGLLSEQVFAETAVQEAGGWLLNNTITYRRDNETPVLAASLKYAGDLRPASAGARSGAPEEMSLATLGYFIENSGFGIRPVWVYQTWWHKRITLVFSALLMIALCVPLVAKFRRGGGLGVMFGLGVGMGFIFFVVDGIAISMGELGFVTPWLAAWLPIAVFGLLAAVLTLRAEAV